MSLFVIGKLRAWAARRDRELHGAIGYKSCCSILSDNQSTEPDYTPDIDLDYHDMNLCVSALRVSGHVEMYEAIYYCYVRTDMKVDTKIKQIGCSKQTYYNRLEAAYPLLLGWLNDLACDIAIPVESNSKVA